MIRHIFMLTWNKRKQNIFLVTELFFFFLAISFLIFVPLASKKLESGPLNFDSEHLVDIDITYQTDSSAKLFKESIMQMKEVRSASLTNRTPYNGIYYPDSVKSNGRNIEVYTGVADEHLKNVLSLQMTEGKWFDKIVANPSKNPIIISTTLKEELFPNVNAIGKTITSNKGDHVVVGVVKNFNDGMQKHNDKFYYGFNSEGRFSNILVKLKGPLTEKIYLQLERKRKEFAGTSEYGQVVLVDQRREQHEKSNSMMVSILSLVSAFLIINIVLGLYSTLYQNINKRRSEIGIRRAAGATSGAIYRQIIFEVWCLTACALVIGIAVAYQFVLFNTLKAEPEDYIKSMFGATIFIYLLVTLCALYPAYLAARIHPADALHDD